MPKKHEKLLHLTTDYENANYIQNSTPFFTNGNLWMLKEGYSPRWKTTLFHIFGGCVNGRSIVPKDATTFWKVIYNVIKMIIMCLFSPYIPVLEKSTLLSKKALVRKNIYMRVLNITLLVTTIKVENM